MKKQVQVHCLPTDKASHITRNTYNFTPEHGGAWDYNVLPIVNGIDRGYEFNHLYITTNESPKVGDWYIGGNKLGKADGKYGTLLTDKKVVATDDITIISDFSTPGQEFVSQISLEFQQAYVRECNKGNVITEAQMEMEELYLYPDGNLSKTSRLAPNAISILQPKLNEQRYVTILPIAEKLYTKEELIKLCRKALLHNNEYMPETRIDNFIKQNL